MCGINHPQMVGLLFDLPHYLNMLPLMVINLYHFFPPQIPIIVGWMVDILNIYPLKIIQLPIINQ